MGYEVHWRSRLAKSAQTLLRAPIPTIPVTGLKLLDACRYIFSLKHLREIEVLCFGRWRMYYSGINYLDYFRGSAFKNSIMGPKTVF